MVRRNKVLIAFLMTVLMASVMFVAINTANAANPNIIREPSNEMQLVVDFDDNELQLGTTAVEGYYYQYWVRTKVLTDATTVVVDDPDANLATEQFIWQMRREFSNQPNAQISVDSNDVDENGRYSVIVRVKDGLEGPIVDEIYGSYTPAGISEVKIDGKTVNGEVIIKKGSTVPVSIISHTSSVTAYKIFGKDESLLYDSDQASGNLDISSLAMGNNVLRAEITAGGSKDSLYFNVYVYDEYVAAQMPEIILLDGTSNSQGATTFTMSVQYADGTPIPIGNAGMFDFKLTSDGKSPDAQIVPETINDVASFKVQFTVNYAGYGIYQTVGTVSRKDVNGADDKIVIYYDRYIRSGVTLNQTAEDENNNDLASVNYTVAKDAEITINATGDIPDVTNETYAFYREDASGWVLIRDYSTKTDFIWTPQKAGVYNIQARIKEGGKDAPGSYQKAVTRTYTIVDDALTGTLDVYAYDFGTKDKVTSLQAGRPCKIFAEYTGEWDTKEILYMFTLTSTNLGTVYLNKYSLSKYIMFVPGKVDNYKITARAISLNSYGYKDISGDLVISSGIDKLFVSFDLNYEDAPELNDMELARGAAYGELPEVSRTGYTFIGWYTAKTGGTKVISTTSAENSYHTLYARWAIIHDNVAFNANKGSGSTEPDMKDFEGETITLTYGEALPAIADKAAPIRYGYEFNGFWTSASAGTQLYKPDLTANVEALEVMLTENVLYASWTAKNVTITYANTENSDFVAPSSYSVAFDSNYATAANYNTRFPSISKDYYTFIGWYTKNGASTGDWGEKITADSTKLTDENGVVYARWEAKTEYDFTSASDMDAFTVLPFSGCLWGGGTYAPDGLVTQYDATEEAMKLTVTDANIQTIQLNMNYPLKTNDIVVWTVDMVLPAGQTLSNSVWFRAIYFDPDTGDVDWAQVKEHLIGSQGQGNDALEGLEIDTKPAAKDTTQTQLYICTWGDKLPPHNLHTTVLGTVYYIRKVQIVNSADLISKNVYDFTNPMDKSLFSIHGVNPLDDSQPASPATMEFDKTENCLKITLTGSNVASLDLLFNRPLNVGEKIKWTVDVVLPSGETLTGPVIFRPIDDDWGWTIFGDTWLGTAGDSEVIGGIVQSGAATDNNTFTVLEIVSWGDFPDNPAYDAHTTVAGTVYYIRSVEIIPAA